MITVEQVRKRMRISHDLVDDDIAGNMEAARLDMCRVGVSPEADDALTDKAVELYCKAQFDYQGKGERFMKNYERLRDALSMVEGYGCGTR